MSERQEREVRYCNLQIRSEQDMPSEIDGGKYYVVHGLPIVVNSRTALYTDENGLPIYEVIENGALDDCDFSDVVFNINHGEGNHAVARTRNNTLFLNRTERGIECDVLLDKDNPRCVQAYKDIESGLLDKMSFAFTISDQRYDSAERCFHVNGIDKVYDVSAVEFPAYNDTQISARRLSMAVAEREKAVADERQQRISELLLKIDGLLAK